MPMHRLVTTNQHLQFLYAAAQFFPGTEPGDIHILKEFYDTLQDRVAKYEIERHTLLQEKEKLEKIMGGGLTTHVKGIPVINMRLDSYNEITKKIKDLDDQEFKMVLSENVVSVINDSINAICSDREIRTETLNAFPYPNNKEQNIKVLVDTLEDIKGMVGDDGVPSDEAEVTFDKTQESAADGIETKPDGTVVSPTS